MDVCRLFFCFYSHAFFQCKVKARNTQDSVRYQSELYQNHVHARGPSVHGGAAPAEHDEHGARGHWRGAPRAQPRGLRGRRGRQSRRAADIRVAGV